MMKAWVIEEKVPTGGLADALTLKEDLPKPTVGPKEILVQTAFCSLAIDDIRIAENRFLPFINVQPTKEKPFVIGHECAGTVTEVGSEVTNFAVGDRVYGTTPPPGKALAEYVLLPAKTSGKIPEGFSMQQAVAYITGASVGSKILKNLPSSLEGKTIVLVGASTSIGSTLLQRLVELKAEHVFAVCSGKNAAKVQALGAKSVLDYKVGPWEDQLLQQAEGVDYVIDLVGGPTTEAAAKKVLKKSSDSKFVTAIGPFDTSDKAIGWSGLFSGLGALAVRLISWRGPKYAWAVQDDPHDHSTPALGTNVQPLIQCEVNGWDKAAVAEAVRLVDSHRAVGRVLLKLS